MPGGRPTKYTEDVIDKCYEFFDVEPYTKVEEEVASAGRKVKVIKERPTLMPSIAGFAASLYVNKSTIYEWAKKNPEFSDALDWARIQQERLLIMLGLSGDYNSGFAKFLLINTGEYKDKIEQDIHQTSEIVLRDLDSDL